MWSPGEEKGRAEGGGVLLGHCRGARSAGGAGGGPRLHGALRLLHWTRRPRAHGTPTVSCCVSARVVSEAGRIISCCSPHLSSVASVNQVTNRSQGQLLALTSQPGRPVTEPMVSLPDASGKYQGGQRPSSAIRGGRPGAAGRVAEISS